MGTEPSNYEIIPNSIAKFSIFPISDNSFFLNNKIINFKFFYA